MIGAMVAEPGTRIPDTLADFRALARTRLDAFARVTVPQAPGIRRAAVVLCVVEHQEAPAVIVIRRAYRGRNAGQWGLPGGRAEEGETLAGAAVRELHEELGLGADPEAVLGFLDDFPAASGFAITPIVTTIADIGDLTPSPDEVHSVHFVDLRRLAADDVPHWVHRPGADRRDGPPNPETGLLQMRFSTEMTIHAPTGAMLWQFREVILRGTAPEAARVAHFRQPDWTEH